MSFSRGLNIFVGVLSLGLMGANFAPAENQVASAAHPPSGEKTLALTIHVSPPHLTDFRTALPDLSHYPTFNGFNPKEAAFFWRDWHLVTTRFRVDNGELRFVFANDQAWKAMMANKLPYPDGSIFAKVAFMTDQDPAFPASLKPSYWSRIQFMKKDSTKYQNFNGWGYAYYMGNRKEDAENSVVACAACHQIVKEKDYIFSEPAFLSESRTTPYVTKMLASFFKREPRFKLPPEIQTELKTPEAKSVESEIQVSYLPVFSGTVSEIMFPMMESANVDGLPYLVYDQQANKGSYLLVLPIKPIRSDCKRSLKVIQSLPVTDPKTQKVSLKRAVRLNCDGVVEWNK